MTGSVRRPKAKVTSATGADHDGVGSDVLDALYPVRRILNLIGDKWTPVVLYCLSIREVRRFNEMQRQIPDISKKMLIQTLRGAQWTPCSESLRRSAAENGISPDRVGAKTSRAYRPALCLGGSE